VNEIEEIPSTKTGESCLEEQEFTNTNRKKPNNQHHENRDRIKEHVEHAPKPG